MFTDAGDMLRKVLCDAVDKLLHLNDNNADSSNELLEHLQQLQIDGAVINNASTQLAEIDRTLPTETYGFI